ncbi:MAG: protein kinase [archaeon]|nr:protein kinase [archaeon]
MRGSKGLDKVELEKILEPYKIKNELNFSYYLKDVYFDLVSKSDQKNKGINKISFFSYYYLPGIISERLFAVMNIKKNNYIDITEFAQGMKKLFSFDYAQTSKFVFDFYDFDKDNKISAEDIRIILSYIRSVSDNYLPLKDKFKERIETQEELCFILDKCFKEIKGDLMNYEQFIYVVENICSDIYLIILLFLLIQKPFTEKNLDTYDTNVKISNKDDLKKKIISTPKSFTTIKIKSPWKTALFINKTGFKRSSRRNPTFNKNIGDIFGGKKFQFPSGDLQDKLYSTPKASNNLIFRTHSINSFQDSYESEDSFKLSSSSHSNDPDKFKEFQNELIQDIPKEEEDSEESNSDENISFEGYLYKIKENKIKKLYFKLINNDLYYFKSPTDSEKYGMHNMSGLFLKEENPLILKGNTYYCLSLRNEQKTRYYYCDNQNEFRKWLKKFEIATGSDKFEDNYEMEKELGQGKFGLVMECKQKSTGKKYAVKILSKAEMEIDDLEMARTEVEILKICQHPNIISLIDVFETTQEIYLILERCIGGDLYKYIVEKKMENVKKKQPEAIILSEEKICDIIHKILTALYYLHSFGIAHRDIKANNILLTSNDDNFDVKLTDFGLSKIIGPNEKCSEPFGTLTYVAPEILLDEPYSKSVDIWSVGILTFFLLTQSFPFTGKTEDEISEQILKKELSFQEPIWRNFSKESKKFVKGMLEKKVEKRFTLKDALCHEWIKTILKDDKIIEQRINDDYFQSFQNYSSPKSMENNK